MLSPQIEERFNELPRPYQKFLTGDFINEATTVFGAALDLTEEQTNILENGFVLYLLFIFTDKDLIEYLDSRLHRSTGANRDVVLAFIASLPEYAKHTAFTGLVEDTETFSLPSQKSTTVEYFTPATEHEGVAYKDTPVSESLNADPVVEKDHKLAAVPGIRTMARDIEAISTYDDVVHSASSQDTLLTTTPNTPVDSDSRWESD